MKFHLMNMELNYTTQVAVGKWKEMQNKVFIHRQNGGFAGVCKTQLKAFPGPNAWCLAVVECAAVVHEC